MSPNRYCPCCPFKASKNPPPKSTNRRGREMQAMSTAQNAQLLQSPYSPLLPSTPHQHHPLLPPATTTMKPFFLLLPLLLLFLSAAVATPAPGRLMLDFVIGKATAGATRPWDLALLPDATAVANPGAKEADFIAALPGQPHRVGARQYSGYVPVDEKAGRHFFYYFAEARKNATALPLFVWLNGGPGCSSVGSGAFLEHGPLLVAPGGKSLRVSRHSWIKFAHLLYVDSATGTGFSYSDALSDYQSYNDAGIAADNLRFLVNWLARFPGYAGREIYLGGEGYAGNYVPQLANFILNRNHAGKGAAINLKGLILANPVLDADEDRWGVFDTLWSHGMISRAMMDALEKECIPNGWTRGCVAAMKVPSTVVAPLYMFDLTASVCDERNLPAAQLTVNEYYECREKDVATYLGSPEVQKALHVNPAKAPKTWAQCNSDVAKAYKEITVSALPIFKNLLSSNISVLVYSGDADAVVPAMSSRLSIKKLNLVKTTKWHPWFVSKIEAGGFTEVYKKGFTYATVKGAGHFVAKTKGAQLQVLLELYLSGNLKTYTIGPIGEE